MLAAADVPDPTDAAVPARRPPPASEAEIGANPLAVIDLSEPEPDLMVIPLGTYRGSHPSQASLVGIKQNPHQPPDNRRVSIAFRLAATR